MDGLKYSLNNYSFQKALLWGNFSGHVNKAKEGKWGNRIVHALIAAVEFLPIVGQFASIFEFAIVEASRSLSGRKVKIQTDTNNISSTTNPVLVKRIKEFPDVISEYNKKRTTDADSAKQILLETDDNGNTVFHRQFFGGQNLQVNTLNAVKENPKLYLECMVKEKNNDGESALDLAIETGQMAVVSDFFPKVGESKFAIDQEEKKHLEETLTKLINTLADSEQRKKLYKRCPEGIEYDQLNHILSAVHALIRSGFAETFCDAVQELGDDHLLELPYELQNYSELQPGQMTEKYQKLSQECKALDSADAVSQKMDDWQLDAKNLELQPADYIKLNSFPKNILLIGHVIQSLTAETEKERNGHMNVLIDLLDPFRSYDQSIDFNNEELVKGTEGEPILFEIVKMVVETKCDLKRAKEIVKKLIVKCPDLYPALNGKKEDLLDFLETFLNNERAENLKQFFMDLNQSLPMQLFETRSKKELKYYLEAKGRELTTH